MKKSAFPPTLNCDNINPEPTITCESSPYGSIPHSTNNDQFTYPCNDQNVCTLSCDGNKVPNIKEWVCNTISGEQESPYGHEKDTKPLERIDDIDTPCGNANEVTTTTCSEKKKPFFSGGPELFSNVVSEQDENEEVLVLADPSCAKRSFQKALKGL